MSPLARLSVVITVSRNRAWAERAIQSVLQQSSDPIGSDIVLVDGSPGPDALEYLQPIFGAEISSGKLELVHRPGIVEPGAQRNIGAARAQGSWLAFLDARDTWSPNRLVRLAPLLGSADLVFGLKRPLPAHQDKLSSLIAEGEVLVPSSIAVRRKLFEAAHGFPERGLPFLGVLGAAELDFCLKCVAQLESKERLAFTGPDDIRIELGPLEAVPAFQTVLKLRETLGLLASARDIPKRYWPTLGKRLLNDSKSWLAKKKR